MLIPPAVATALAAGATLCFSTSGGKDSQAMGALLAAARAEAAWPGRFVAMHANLGRVEWPQTASHVERTAAEAGAELIVVRRSDGRDLLDRIEGEAARTEGTGKLFWPSSSARYCTADLKRDPLLSGQRRLGEVVVSAQGVRADESPARRRRTPLTVERRATASRIADLPPEEALAARRPGERLILNWLPIHDLSLEDVWAACGTSGADLARRRALLAAAEEAGDEEAFAAAFAGWPAHPAYVYGISRLSCALCVIAKRADLVVGGRRNPALLAAYRRLEDRTGQSFQPRLSLREIETEIAGPTAGGRP